MGLGRVGRVVQVDRPVKVCVLLIVRTLINHRIRGTVHRLCGVREIRVSVGPLPDGCRHNDGTSNCVVFTGGTVHGTCVYRGLPSV